MKKVILLFFILITVSQLSAQRYDWREQAPRVYPKYSLKGSMFTFLNFNSPKLELGLEHYFKEDYYLQYRLGVLLPYDLNQDFRTIQARGYTVRIEARDYIKGMVKESRNYYFGVDIPWQQSFFTREGNFLRASGAYQQVLRYQSNEITTGFNVFYGSTVFLTKRITLDGAVGLGYQLLRRRNINLPEDAVPINDFFFGENTATDGTFSSIKLYISATIGFVLSE